MAYERFKGGDFVSLEEAFIAFQKEQVHWLDDFALFMALKDAHNDAPWGSWEPALRDRKSSALIEARNMYASAIECQAFRQFLFFRQWAVVRAHAHQKGIKIIGDIPIFATYDSADVWANPELFY